ncbi:TlpA family protein disulfide reductase [Hoyosella subflava]|uniref:Alkyl hydroperoxide reductase/ Thiol specific antioxidant/ Mal allergen n=1 Tax=Hoyosella subflava (strain DSM 45089 / JCM 17490 / NBRC 109087 / DQS3-9A1) TaxID=443218 RepID=F6EQH0_HOYSD|nr:redoxin domain-containing protein [Hoyosella subflava]AEF40655.1 alkyl hydroperoxide reductase/ Thiol specific antioxidant/ Mal allergen [Hoyosella subflava DQS3-9A1]
MTTASTTLDEGARYRIDRPTFKVIMRDLRIPSNDLGAGDAIPDVDLPTTEGGRFTTDSIAADGRPILLVFGSLTCPVTESAGRGLLDLHRRYGDVIRFVVVNVREAHPGADIPQPRVIGEKMHNARNLKGHHGFAFEVAVDDIHGSVHRAFGARPSSAYIIDPSGIIVFRAHWSNILEPIEEALRAVIAGRAPSRAKVGQTARALIRMAAYSDVALGAAGRGALRDFWRAAPPAAALIAVSSLFRFLPSERRAAPTVTATLAIGITAATGMWLLLMPLHAVPRRVLQLVALRMSRC